MSEAIKLMPDVTTDWWWVVFLLSDTFKGGVLTERCCIRLRIKIYHVQKTAVKQTGSKKLHCLCDGSDALIFTPPKFPNTSTLTYFFGRTKKRGNSLFCSSVKS